MTLGKLAGEGGKLPNPHLLIRPFIAKEAVLSSRIEGTQASLSEMLVDEIGATSKGHKDDIQEVRNYIEALDLGISRLSDLPLCLRLIKEVHKKLMSGERGAHATPGEFRRSQNWIGTPGCTLATAKYVPPPPAEMNACLGDFELFLHDKNLPALIHITICHYQFEAIHPFLDGNGRVGRLLISLLLIERKLLPSSLLYLSAFFEATRDDYYRALFAVSAHGAWEDWLSYFLNGVALQSSDALSRAERINQQLAAWMKIVSNKGSSLPFEIVNHLAINPFVTIKKISTQFGVAYTTAQRAVRTLEALEILHKVDDKKRDQLLCAREILTILEEPTSI